MAKSYTNFDEWTEANGWTEEDIQKAYDKLKKRVWIYGLLSFLTPLWAFLMPFWFRALYLKKCIRYRNMGVKPNGIASLFFGLWFIGMLVIIPWILIKIIVATNWGMGINKI